MKEGLNCDMKFCFKIPQLTPCYKTPLPREGVRTLFQSFNIKIRLSLHKAFFFHFEIIQHLIFVPFQREKNEV